MPDKRKENKGRGVKKPVARYNRQGQLVAFYSSRREAAEAADVDNSTISASVSKRRLWVFNSMYVDVPIGQRPPLKIAVAPKAKTTYRPVVHCDAHGRLLTYYDSLMEAGRACFVSPGGIKSLLDVKTRKKRDVCGYHFRNPTEEEIESYGKT